MGFHPVNLGLRFLLELVSLVGLFRLGLALADGVPGWFLGLGVTLVGMVLWATFRVPGDRSAKGDAPIAIGGAVRLSIEVVIFGLGAFGWFVSGPEWLAWANLGALGLHHALSYDRIGWLLNRPTT